MEVHRVLAVLALLLALIVSLSFAPAYGAQEGMKVYLQWAQEKPQDWGLVDSSNWSVQQSLDDPTGDIDAEGKPCGDSMLSNQKGLVYAVNVQGVTFNTCDHYGVEDYGAGVKITCIADDPVWYPAGEWRYARVWTFLPLAFAPSVGQINTVQEQVIYAEPKAIEHFLNHGFELGKDLFAWEELPMPDSQYIRHGIWLSDAKAEEHEAAQTTHGWREWTQ